MPTATTTLTTLAPAGPAFALIDDALAPFPEYRGFRRGEIGRAEYDHWVGSGAVTADQVGLTFDELNLSARFPVDERHYTRRMLEELRESGLIAAVEYPEEKFEALRRVVAAEFRHGPQKTYIFPEEARLLFALAYILAPRRTVFPGSYYGYWTVWAMPGIIAAQGTATLVDVNPDVMERARENLTRLGLATGVEFATQDAIAYGETLADVDLCVLDAEGPKDAPDPTLRDKAIYEPIMRATTPAIRGHGVLVAHNMLLENLSQNAYFTGKVANNERQFEAFHEHLHAFYDIERVFPTTEGVGVYRKAA